LRQKRILQLSVDSGLWESSVCERLWQQHNKPSEVFDQKLVKMWSKCIEQVLTSWQFWERCWYCHSFVWCQAVWMTEQTWLQHQRLELSLQYESDIDCDNWWAQTKYFYCLQSSKTVSPWRLIRKLIFCGIYTQCVMWCTIFHCVGCHPHTCVIFAIQ